MANSDQRARNRWARAHKKKTQARKGERPSSTRGPRLPPRSAEQSSAPVERPAAKAVGPGRGRFRADLDRFLDLEHPLALSRFHDGEFHMLEEMPYMARSGWRLYRPSWMRERLLASLQADLEGYWVGISPPCDWPQGTALFRSLVTTKQVTFATLFWHRNFAPFITSVRSGALKDACIVTSGQGHYKVPSNGAVEPWDIDALVDELLEERRPILVAAGPCACVIVHEYWRRAEPHRRQTILDVGAAIDPIVHGRNTRDFHDPKSPLRQHECSFRHTVPWARKRKKRPKGWKGYLSRPRKGEKS